MVGRWTSGSRVTSLRKAHRCAMPAFRRCTSTTSWRTRWTPHAALCARGGGSGHRRQRPRHRGRRRGDVPRRVRPVLGGRDRRVARPTCAVARVAHARRAIRVLVLARLAIRVLYTVSRGIADIAENFDGERGSTVPIGVRDPERLVDAYRSLAGDVAGADPWCVVHGDPHIRNIYVDPSRRVSFIDWQLVQRGPWYLDVGYHIATMLSVEDRRAHHDALVAEYLDRLSAAGAPRPSDGGSGRQGLPRSFVHGFYLWAITLRVDSTLRRRSCTGSEPRWRTMTPTRSSNAFGSDGGDRADGERSSADALGIAGPGRCARACSPSTAPRSPRPYRSRHPDRGSWRRRVR